MKCGCIHQHRGQWPLVLMCRVLGVARSSYYAWVQRRPSRRAQERAGLLAQVRALYAASEATYGSPRIHRLLQRDGVRCSRQRIARLMHAQGLVAICRRRRPDPRTTRSAARPPVVDDHVARQFGVRGPDQVWVADLTYVPTAEGWLYLALVLDLGTRRVVGWAGAATLHAELAHEALQLALGRRAVAPGLVHHSDRGRQYTSTAYQRQLAAHGILPNFGRRGDCWDNAVAESFIATLKCERLHRQAYRTRAQALADIVRYIETWYNPRRLHSTLGYLSPAEYEAHYAA